MTLDAIADDLALVLTELDLHDAVIVGHSMGGMALAQFCADHHDVLAERVRGLMFLATSAAMIDADSMIGAVVGLANILSRLTGDGARLRYGWRDTDLSAVLVRGAFGRRVERTGGRGRPPDDVGAARPRSPLQPGDRSPRTTCAATCATSRCRRSVVVGSADRLTSVAHARVIAERDRRRRAARARTVSATR